jgi:hypothetical protein
MKTIYKDESDEIIQEILTLVREDAGLTRQIADDFGYKVDDIELFIDKVKFKTEHDVDLKS